VTVTKKLIRGKKLTNYYAKYNINSWTAEWILFHYSPGGIGKLLAFCLWWSCLNPGCIENYCSGNRPYANIYGILRSRAV